MGKKPRVNIKSNYSTFTNEQLNIMTYQEYMNQLTRICMSIFKWENLPNSMNERYLEQSLYYYGKAGIYKRDGVILNANCVTGQGFNMYYEPLKINVTPQGKSFTYQVFQDDDDLNSDKYAILVYNNQIKVPTYTSIQLYAYRLCNCDRTADINMNAMKTPVIYYTNQSGTLSFTNLQSKIDNNEYTVMVDKAGMEGMKIEALDTKATFLVDKIQEAKKQIWNECLTFLGINNIINEKKERLVTDEVDNNNELLNLNLQSFLIPRQHACDQMNKLFGLNGDKKVKIKLNSDLENTIKRELGLSPSLQTFNEEVVDYGIME